MLTHIYVKDFTIVQRLELEFQPGMTTLTGETGAGKSILIDALGLALGDKGEVSLIRAGCSRAEISATFDLARQPEARAWLADNGLDQGDECLVRRLLERESRSRAFINGQPVALSQLQALGSLLVDIHGQHAHQSLLRPTEQRRLLDEYAGAQELAGRVAAMQRRYRDAATRLETLRGAAQERGARLDLLSFQRGELEALAPSRDELRDLDEEQRRLRNVSRLQETSGRLLRTLYDDKGAVESALNRALTDLDEMLGFSARLEEPRTLIEGALIQIQEAASGLRHFAEELELDPNRLEQVEQRLSDLHDAARKYRVTPAELPERLEEIGRELDGLEHADQTLEQLAQEVDSLRAGFLAVAGQLSEQRRAAGAQLTDIVTASMATLGMGGGVFQVRLQPLTEDKAGPAGLENVEFLVSANPGQPAQRLAKVASGGELSRISLAIQVATARCGQVPTLIFDEVDVGIGGRVAEIVGQMLRGLGGARQVLCVTHLPQVAAQAHQHLRVQKSAQDGGTQVGIQSLGRDDRVEEIARMLGGVEITRKTLAHAKEMLGK